MKTEILNIKKSYLYRNEEEIKSGNRVVVINENGVENEVSNIKGLNVEFKGSNSLVKIHSDLKFKKINIRMGEGGYVYIGKRGRIRHTLSADLGNLNSTLIINEGADIGSIKIFLEREPSLEVIIGSSFLAANNIEFRSSDAHTIFSLNDPSKAINKPNFGIHIGDHVWVGENVILAKDVVIPENCVIGACSFVCKKEFNANSIIAGVPARIVKENINWDSKSIFQYENTMKNKTINNC